MVPQRGILNIYGKRTDLANGTGARGPFEIDGYQGS